jgi:uncharacterized protein (DUF4415 family)
MSMVRYERGKVPPLTSEQEAEMRLLAERPDSEIDLSDMPEWTDEDWARAIRSPYANTLRVDSEVLAWLNKHQHGYANTILRDVMLRERQTRRQQ